MPNIKQEKISDEKVALMIEIPTSEMIVFLRKAAEKLSNEKPAKGFRPGKIDVDAAKKIYGEMALYEASLDFVVRSTLQKAVQESKIDFVGQPDITVIKCAPGNPVSYKATFVIAPQVTLADYTKISIERKNVALGEDAVDEVLTELQESRATEVKVDRAVAQGDHIVADVSIFLDSVPLDGGQMKGQHFIVGKQEVWEGFGKEVEGMKAGEKKEFTLTIPKTHFQKNIAGKRVEFNVTINEIFERTLPKLDESFAKTLGAFDSIKSLKKQVRENLKIEAERKEQERVENELLTKLVEQSSFTSIPVEMVEREKDRVLEETRQMVTSRGMEWQGYLDHLKKTEEEVRNGFDSAAERRIKNNLVLIALAEKRHTQVSEEEIDKEFQSYARFNPEGVKEEQNVERIRMHIHLMLTHRKALADTINEITQSAGKKK